MQRARLFLVRNGYPWARVDVRIEPNAPHHEVHVVLHVEPGQPVLVGANRTEAIPPHLEPKAAKLLAIEPNEIFADERVNQRIRSLLDLLQEDGYAHARVTTRLARADSTHVDVAFVVEAGPVYRFGYTRVQGTRADLVGVVKHTAGIPRGARYSPSRIERATESLRLLNLFRRVEVRTEPETGDTLTVVCDLADRAPRSFEVGVGYWTQERLRINAEWKHYNLLRAGRGLSVQATYSQFEQTAALSLWKPALFRSRTWGVTTLRGRHQSEVNYYLRGIELELAANTLVTNQTTLRAGLTTAYNAYQARTAAALATIQDAGLLTTLGLDWTRDALKDKLDPKGGSYAMVHGEFGLPGMLSQSHFVLGDAHGSKFFSLPFVVLSTRLRVSLARPFGDSEELLPDWRFYSGGANSMRGFRRHYLGPLDATGKPVGGEARLEASVEVRRKLFGRVSAAGFVDTGQAWLRAKDFRPADLAIAAGPGLLIATPIGPIRGDLGVRIHDHSVGQPRSVFSLSVGHVF